MSEKKKKSYAKNAYDRDETGARYEHEQRWMKEGRKNEGGSGKTLIQFNSRVAKCALVFNLSQCRNCSKLPFLFNIKMKPE